jgi:hypothetical protein
LIIKLKYERRENHVICRVMIGLEQLHLTHTGVLIMNMEEFQFFRQLTKDGTLVVKGAEYQESDATDGGSSSSYPRVQLPPDRS